MKGVINKGIQDLVETRFGNEMWQKIKTLAGCTEPFFAVGEDYPDEQTLALSKSASEVFNWPQKDIHIEFGKFWVPNTGKNSYPSFYALAGRSPREFLLNMNRVHEVVTRNIANAKPPRFGYEELPDGRLIMRYMSERKLCTVFHGLVLGVGLLFGHELDVEERTCMHLGDDACEFEITFP